MESLKQRSIKAVAWDFLGTLGTQGIGFVISIYLARLLTPEEFGIVGMAMVFIGFSQIFMNAGFGAALVQRQDNTSLTYSSVFYFNILFGVLLFALFQVLAVPISEFYEAPVIENIVKILAINIPISALNVVQTIILTKELRFKALSLRLLLAGVISGVIGVVMAFKGYGVYSLVTQTILSTMITTIVLWKVSEWRPKWEFSLSELRSLFSFSGYVFSGQVLNQVVNRTNTLIVGKIFSASTLGFFTRAESLNKLVVKYASGSIRKVFFPAMSQIQGDPDQQQKIFFNTLNIVSFLTFLLSGTLILSGETIIINLFGEKWRPSVFIFQILMLKVFNYPINALIAGAFLALGKAKENFRIEVIKKSLQLLPILVAVLVDFESFLYSLVAISWIATLINNIAFSYYFKISFRIQLFYSYSFLLLFFLALGVTYFIPFSRSTLSGLIVNLLCYIISFIFLAIVINPKIRKVIQTLPNKLLGKISN